MAAENFEKVTEWLLVHEGGYVNHPRDPGGATNRGITQAVYDGYRRRSGKPVRSVREVTTTEVYHIYRTQYWDRVWGDELPAGLDYAVYDFAVNSGPARAAKFLQRILGVAQDGVIGNETMGAVRLLEPHEIEDVIVRLCTDRWNWMKRLSTWDAFGRGWTARVMGAQIGVQERDTGVIDRAVKLARGEPTVAPRREANGPAREEDLGAPAKVRDGFSLEAFGTAAAGAVPGALAAAFSQEGPMQYALSGVVVLAALMAAVVFYRKVLR